MHPSVVSAVRLAELEMRIRQLEEELAAKGETSSGAESLKEASPDPYDMEPSEEDMLYWSAE